MNFIISVLVALIALAGVFFVIALFGAFIGVDNIKE